MDVKICEQTSDKWLSTYRLHFGTFMSGLVENLQGDEANGEMKEMSGTESRGEDVGVRWRKIKRNEARLLRNRLLRCFQARA